MILAVSRGRSWTGESGETLPPRVARLRRRGLLRPTTRNRCEIAERKGDTSATSQSRMAAREGQCAADLRTSSRERLGGAR
jgi:hypothetical protein